MKTVKKEEEMNRKTGSIMLIAGTCIGSGMIALPMVLSKLGILPSVFLMLIVWGLAYLTALITLELNLQAGEGLSLGALGRKFSGLSSEIFGNTALKLLSYALIAVYLYGGASVVQELCSSQWGQTYSFDVLASVGAFLTVGILLLPMRLIDFVNRLVFIALLGVVALLIGGMVIAIDWGQIILISPQVGDLSAWYMVIPVVFTSFGFQVIFHTLTNYCNKSAGMLKQAFFWGTLIPTVVYILWTVCTLSLVNQHNPEIYQKMAAGEVDVGELVRVLSISAQWHWVQMLVWGISIFAIATSVVGVGVGLCDSLEKILSKIPCPVGRRGMSAFLTVAPPYLVALFIPNAFISVLGFAGFILVFVAIVLPLYLFRKGHFKSLFYPELKSSLLLMLAAFGGAVIIWSELLNIL